MVPTPSIESWERRTAWPLTAFAGLFLGAYAWPILQPGLSAGLTRACGFTVTATWLLFGSEYAVRFALARPKLAFLRRTLLDLVSLLLPVLRSLRLLRLVTVVRRLDQRATVSFRGRVVAYVGFSVVLAVLMAALSVLQAERGRTGANIATFGDALWWSSSTITTVGYGDLYPVTGTGRSIGLGLMICGIGLLGVVTASIASWFLERVRDDRIEADLSLQVELDRVQRAVTTMDGKLTLLLAQQTRELGPPG